MKLTERTAVPERVGPDQSVKSPGKIPHRWMNGSDTPFRLFVVTVPLPTREIKPL